MRKVSVAVRGRLGRVDNGNRVGEIAILPVHPHIFDGHGVIHVAGGDGVRWIAVAFVVIQPDERFVSEPVRNRFQINGNGLPVAIHLHGSLGKIGILQPEGPAGKNDVVGHESAGGPCDVFRACSGARNLVEEAGPVVGIKDP